MRIPILAARRLAIALLVVAAVVAAAPGAGRVSLPAIRLTDSYNQRIASLQARYNALGGQISGLQGQERQVGAQVAAVQQRVAGTQQSLAAVESRITQLNIALTETEASIQVDTAHLDKERAQLSQVMVEIYTDGGTSVVAGLVDSQNVDAFMNELDSAGAVSKKFQQLISTVKADEARLQVLEQDQQTQLGEANQAQQQLQVLDAQLRAQEAQLQQEEVGLTGQAAQLVDQRQSIMGQIDQVRAEQRAAEAAAAAAAARAAAAADSGAGVTLNGALAPFAFGATVDYFPWGQCTWYVASLRQVSWSGNAVDWFANAQAAGASTGSRPRAGAIVVWGSGGGYSVYGHVAYVVAVHGPGDFVVDESNYFDVPGVLDQREVTTLGDVEGFIY